MLILADQVQKYMVEILNFIKLFVISFYIAHCYCLQSKFFFCSHLRQ